MSNFDETLMKRLTKLEREVERLRVKERPAGGSGVTDHGALTGLSDNDHPQYLLTTGKAADSDKLDGIDSTGFATAGHDHSGVYLPVSGKAADADKLDNIDSTGFVKTSGNQTVAGIKTFSSLPTLPTTTPTTNQPVRKGYADATYGRPVFLKTPLTSTSWDGDAKSTTAKTKIDLSSVFGAPAGIKGIFVRLVARDSGSSSGYCQLGLSPNSTANSMAIQCYLQGVPNDVYVSANGVVPCDANGDIYYQIIASGTGTLDAIIEIWGYWL